MPGKKKSKNKNESDISKDIRELLRKTFPHDVVEMTITPDESYLADVHPELQAKLMTIRGAALLYEREPIPELKWAEGDDPDEDPPLDMGLSSSYHLFFLALNSRAFTYECETENEDEDGELQQVAGECRIGCAVAVCALAPLAVIRFTQMEQYDDGSNTLPDIEDNVFSLDGEPIEPEMHIRETFGDQAVLSLTSLREQIVKILEAVGISLLPPAEARKPVSWLEAGEDAFVGEAVSGKPITVQDALFFKFP